MVEGDPMQIAMDTSNNGEVKSEQLEEPITNIGLKEKLIKARNEFLGLNEKEEEKESKSEDKKEQDEKKPKPRLDRYAAARLLLENCHFCMFKHGSTARLATYDFEQGIYTFDYSLLKRYISYVAPRFDEAAAKTVIYHLTNMVGDQPTVKPYNDKNIIPVGNGLFEPSTNTLYPFRAAYFITGKIATCIPYEENGETTIRRVTHPVYAKPVHSPKITNIDGTTWEFDSWLKTIANDDDEIYTLLWQVIAVACNANRQMGKAIFLLGRKKGNNGKGTFQTLLQNLVGEDNYSALKINQFSERFALEDLIGRSVVIGDDNPANVVIADKSNFNSIVTNDIVNVEPKGEKHFTTKLNLTVIQSCNKMPRFSDDGGVYRRMIIVPFHADFNGKKENKAIKNQYLTTRDVLQYVLYTALKKGTEFKNYTIPGAAKKELKKYEHVNNPVSSFIDDVFKKSDGNRGLEDIERLPMDFLYGVWKDYALENSYHDVGRNTFNEKAFDRITQIYPDRNYRIVRERLRKTDSDAIYSHQKDEYWYQGNKEFHAGKFKSCLEKTKIKSEN